MNRIVTFMGLGLALVSALALMQWSAASKLKNNQIETTRVYELLKQEQSKLKIELEKKQKKLADLEDDNSEVHRLLKEISRLTAIATEIDRTKSELRRLEQENQSLRRNRDSNSSRTSLASEFGDVEDGQVPGLFFKDDWRFRGNETPEDAVVSLFSTILEEDHENAIKLMSPRMLEQMPEEMRVATDQENNQIVEDMTDDIDLKNEYKMGLDYLEYVTGIHIIGSTQLSENTIQMNVHIKGMEEAYRNLFEVELQAEDIPYEEYDDLVENPTVMPLKMRQIDGKWFFDSPGIGTGLGQSH